MHTFNREEKRKYLVAIIFLMLLSNTVIRKRKGFSLHSCLMTNIMY